MQLIEKGHGPDLDDLRWGEDVHIVPITDDPDDPDMILFGIHDFTRDCYCHPRIQEQCYGRTLVLHSEAVN
jgi:hypothetical protein